MQNSLFFCRLFLKTDNKCKCKICLQNHLRLLLSNITVLDSLHTQKLQKHIFSLFLKLAVFMFPVAIFFPSVIVF